MLLNKIFKSDTSSLLGVIQEHLGDGETDGVNYLFYPSGSPLLLQAHIDSLADYGDKYKLLGSKNILTANGILGADDRAGVFALIEIRARCIARKLTIPSLLFTNFEESGGRGMEEFLKTVSVDDFKHINLAIAIDRRGCNDYVSYVSLEKEVEKYIERFGFISAHGSYSDIKEFSEMTLIPSVNLSAGYYAQHTKMERLHIDELYLTINRVISMIREPILNLYKCKKKSYTSSYNHWDGEGWDYETRSWVKKDKKIREVKKPRWNRGEEEEIALAVCEVCDASAVLQSTFVDGYIVRLCVGCKNILQPYH
jgi:hypothetical protein